MPAAPVQNAVQRLAPLLASLRKLGALTATPITQLDVELPITVEVSMRIGHWGIKVLEEITLQRRLRTRVGTLIFYTFSIEDGCPG